MTDTLIAGDLDLEQLEEAHADDRFPCGYADFDGCPHEARWRYQHECGLLWRVCDTHRLHEDRLALGWNWRICNRCGMEAPKTIPWLPL